MTQTIKAVYLEDRETEFRRFAPIIERALSIGRFECKATWAKDRAALEAALRARPHVVFCDMDLGEGSLRFAGAQITAQLKPKYPDVLFFLLTGQTVSIGKLGSFTPNPDLFINKEYLGTQEYDEFLGDFFTRNLKRHPIGTIEYDFNLREASPRHGGKARFDPADLHSLVEQCLFGVDSGMDGTEVAKVELRVIAEGLSGSAVYSMHIWTGERRNSVPGILKISELIKAKEELANYNRYVKWRLPYLWRVDVLGFGVCENFGAICYSFAMGGGKEPSTVNKFLRAGKTDAVDAVVHSILFSKNQNWYAEREVSDKDGRIYFGGRPYYNNNSRRESRELVFREMFKDLCSAGGIPLIFGEDSFRVDNIDLVNINRCMFGRDWGQVTTCVCHGDMNGNNVMYTGDRDEVAFIDFQNTGFHYLFRDFVSFESSVRLELPGEDIGWSEAQFLQVVQNEIRLINARWERLPDEGSYVSQITKVRDAAHQNFPDEKLEIYVLANTVHSLWLMEKSAKWAKYKQRRLLAAVISGVLHLQAA